MGADPPPNRRTIRRSSEPSRASRARNTWSDADYRLLGRHTRRSARWPAPCTVGWLRTTGFTLAPALVLALSLHPLRQPLERRGRARAGACELVSSLLLRLDSLESRRMGIARSRPLSLLAALFTHSANPGRRGAGAGGGVHGPLTPPARSRPRRACPLSIPSACYHPLRQPRGRSRNGGGLARRGRPRGGRSGCPAGSKELDRPARRCSLSAIPRARHGVDVSRGAASNSTATSGGSLLPRRGRSSASIGAASRPRTSRLQS